MVKENQLESSHHKSYVEVGMKLKRSFQTPLILLVKIMLRLLTCEYVPPELKERVKNRDSSLGY